MAETKIALVVGASNGIGKGLASKLASLSISTVIAGRNKEKTEAVAKEIGAVDWLLVDVNSQADVRRFADVLLSKYKHFDYVVFTACQLFDRKKINADGVEGLLAINFLWRFQLTVLIKDLLANAPQGARVLNVAGAGTNGEVFFDDYNFEHQPWTLMKAALQSQQLNDVFTVEAQRRWGTLGNGISFQVVYPGQVDTGTKDGLHGFMHFFFNTLIVPFKKSTATSVKQLAPLLLEPIGAEGGKLWNAGLFGGAVAELRPAARVVDPEYGAKCWQFCESLIKPVTTSE